MRLFIFFIPFFLLANPFHSQEKSKEISNSVVKIFTVSVKPNYYQPWQMRSQKFSTGSGVIIEESHILTAAHVVTNGSFIQVKKNTDPKKYTASVKWISHEADLAILEVHENGFFEGTKALHLGEMPKRQDGVAVYGYPTGGSEISITQGIISRIEQTFYVHSDFDLLALQIDAAINPGNSGGPVFDEKGEIIGIAMQALTSADNIGYLVPTPIIKHFLEDISDGYYDGFPDDGIFIQTMENTTLKQTYKMSDKTGVLVTKVIKDSSCDGYLHEGDVLLAIDNVSLSDDATILLNKQGRVAANYLIRMHHIGENFKATIIRNGKEQDIYIPLKPTVALIPYEHEKRPKYIIFGGLVFMPLTKNYLYEWGKSWNQKAPIRFVDIINNANFPDEDHDELVFLHSILADEVNHGYNGGNALIAKINNRPINSFSTLVNAITTAKEKNITITLQGGSIIILNREEALKANERLLKRYNIEREMHL